MNAIKKLCFALVFLAFSAFLPNGVFAAVPPEPTYGTAVVDGNTTEWNLVNDFFGYMYRAGNPAKPIESSVHLRYDCNTHTVYVLVLTNGVPGIDGPTYAPAAWAAINSVSNKVYTGNTGNDGVAPDFAWVGLKYDGDPQHVQGYEASFHLDPGDYEIIVHIEVFDSGNAQTSATMGFPGTGIALKLNCSNVPVAEPAIHVNKLISIDGQETWLDAETPPGPSVYEGGDLYFKFVVTNTGNVDLSNISLMDSTYQEFIDSDCTIPTGLPVGDTFECVISATPGAITAQLGPHINTATATGDYILSGTTYTYTNSHDAYYTGERKLEPNISVIKYTNGNDANNTPGPLIVEGNEVTWTYVITNTGNVDLETVTVTDDMLGLLSPDCDFAMLPIGATVTCERKGTATVGQYHNTAIVSGYYGTKIYTARDESHYYGEKAMPEIRIVKLTQGYDWAHQPPGPYVPVGDEVFWTYIVTNTGNVPLTDVTVTDNMLPDAVSDCYDSLMGDSFDGVLAPRESAVCTASGWADPGQYSNTATASGYSVYGTPYASDISHYFGADPKIEIAKYTNGESAPYILPGSPVTWTYQVTNTGNVPLSNVTVTDDKLGVICTIASLAAAEIRTCEATGTAGNTDYSNTATVTGTPPGMLPDVEGGPASSQYYKAEPGIDLVKYVSVDGKKTWLDAKIYPWPQIRLPGEIYYKYVVTNTGNVPLTGVSLYDPVGGCTVPTTLGVGKAFECVYGPLSASYGLNTNTATATGTYQSNTYTDSDFASYFGTLCSYTQGGYAGGGTPGQLLRSYFITLFPSGLQVGEYQQNDPPPPDIPNGYKWENTATGLKNLQTYLAGGGPSGAIASDQLNPTKDLTSKIVPVSAGTLGRQTATLTLNIEFSDHALSMPTGYGELFYCNPDDSLSGLTVLEILDIANNALARGLTQLPFGYSYASLNNLLNNLNRAFDNCAATDWAQTHLFTGVCP